MNPTVLYLWVLLLRDGRAWSPEKTWEFVEAARKLHELTVLEPETIGYRVSVPNLLPSHGDRLAVREDIVTDSDVRAIQVRLEAWGIEYPVRSAEILCALVLGSDKEGEDGQ